MPRAKIAVFENNLLYLHPEWDMDDRVGVKIKPEDITLEKLEEEDETINA